MHLSTKWQRLEKSIMAGCTISVVMFITAINLILHVRENECRSPLAEDCTNQPSCRAYMDDIAVMALSFLGIWWVPRALEQKGELSKYTFSIPEEKLLTIQEEQIRCLGTYSIKDCTSMELKSWLRAIDNSKLQERFKVWYFQDSSGHFWCTAFPSPQSKPWRDFVASH